MVTSGYMGLQWVIRGYRRLQGVTGGYKGVTMGYRDYRGLQVATGGYKGLQDARCIRGYLSNRPHFLWFYRRDNPLGMLGEPEKSL